MPLCSGYIPVPSAVALTRVTVGNTEWLLSKLTPSLRSFARLGVSVGLIESGRRPSSTNTRLMLAVPAAPALTAQASTSAANSERTLIYAPPASPLIRRAPEPHLPRGPSFCQAQHLVTAAPCRNWCKGRVCRAQRISARHG